MKIRSAYDRGKRTEGLKCGKGRTKQAFKAECDINNIMRNVAKTGLNAHNAKYGGNYGEFMGFGDFQESIQAVKDAEDMFRQLPAKVRDRFNNDPSQFLSFVHTEGNDKEMKELGLIIREKKDPPKEDHRQIDIESVKSGNIKEPEKPA